MEVARQGRRLCIDSAWCAFCVLNQCTHLCIDECTFQCIAVITCMRIAPFFALICVCLRFVFVSVCTFALICAVCKLGIAFCAQYGVVVARAFSVMMSVCAIFCFLPCALCAHSTLICAQSGAAVVAVRVQRARAGLEIPAKRRRAPLFH